MFALSDTLYKELKSTNKVISALAVHDQTKPDPNAEATKALASAIKQLAENKGEKIDLAPVLAVVKESQRLQRELLEKIGDKKEKVIDFTFRRTNLGQIASVTATERIKE